MFYTNKLKVHEDYKSIYIDAYVKLKKGRNWDIKGFHQCKCCDQFYWGARNNMNDCTANRRRSDNHIKSLTRLDPKNIIQYLLNRKVVEVSDVLLNY